MIDEMHIRKPKEMNSYALYLKKMKKEKNRKNPNSRKKKTVHGLEEAKDVIISLLQIISKIKQISLDGISQMETNPTNFNPFERGKNKNKKKRREIN